MLDLARDSSARGGPNAIIDDIFTAPEILHETQFCGKADVWSVGVILYMLITGGVLSASPEGVSETGRFSFAEPAWVQIGKNVRSFVCQCLQVDVKKRSSIKHLLDAPLIKMLEQTNLVKNHMSKAISGATCFKLTIVSVLSEIIHQKISINAAKLRSLHKITSATKRHQLRKATSSECVSFGSLSASFGSPTSANSRPFGSGPLKFSQASKLIEE